MRKLSFLIIPLALLSSYTFALEAAPKCIKVDQQQIAGLFKRWNDSLKSGDAKKVSANYLADAVLLPTISSQVRLTDTERTDYFKHFLAKKPVGKIDSRTIRIGCNKAIDIGTYTFTFKDKSTVSARYTFT
ncbi:hypothetical protein ARAF_1522 [Arsenophonus endosymbiont of Aleurodicus floccissimus]|uniref:DUF4440 domain-containing protein n=1 Tax=Arsenophonus endosymbiont of Aleurodicus floccissimus TaxID=2152761 RepID=UPI000E6B0989|nr:DUF4440 domain-containing protein [Arsenophonus endosymbiont of Aleurodicus floccissimus]SPP31856.1 hypothetical protein ARAF_1522 [Arsenophonus endosymbiont of Aleurodicus floccissimus]